LASRGSCRHWLRINQSNAKSVIQTLTSRGSHRNWHRIAQSNQMRPPRLSPLKDLSSHRCKRKKQVVTVTQFHDFEK
jgi:hypothetical protein